MQFLFKTYRVFQIFYPILVLTLLTASSIVVSQADPYQDDRYAPRLFGIPDTISGYAVLAVLTEQNYICTRSGERRLLLQSSQQTLENGLVNFSKASIEQKLNTLGLGKYVLSFMGPGVTREQVMSQLIQARRFSKLHGCISFDVPLTSRQMQAGAETKNPAPYPGYAIIQNSDIANHPNNNAQIVNLVAPPVPDLTQNYVQCHFQFSLDFITCESNWGYSGFLSNGLTVNNYFLQVGFGFAGGPEGVKGLVVWVATYTDPSKAPQGASVNNFKAQPFSIPYIQGDEYYTYMLIFL